MRPKRLIGFALAAAALVLVLAPWLATAQDGSWLDAPLLSWNSPGMAIPAAPRIDGNTDPRCAARDRPAETEEDEALTAAGWRLFLPYQRGWGVTLVAGLSASDGMCRPIGYQWFVFVDGQFAGTIAPQPMDSRADGAGGDVNLWFADQLSAEFVRYAPDDPLCCPSGGTTTVEYRIDQTADGPVLTALTAYQ
jgi:hypothetical protein